MNRTKSIDGLRGFAAISVLIYHCILGLNLELEKRILYVPIQKISGIYDIFAKMLLSVFNGETAVIVFFVLSGAMFSRSCAGYAKKSFSEYVIAPITKRVLRIYPSLIVCLLIFFCCNNIMSFIFPNIFRFFTYKELVDNCLLRGITIHGATWTLQVEMLVLPVLIVTSVLITYFNIDGVVIPFCFSILVWDNFINLLPPSFRLSLFYFIWGFCIPSEHVKLLAKRCSSACVWVVLFIMMFIRQIVPHQQQSGLILQACSAVLFIALLYHDNGGQVEKFLENRVLVYMGG